MSPLEAIDRAEITLFSVKKAKIVKEFSRAISIPNPNFFIGQKFGVGVTIHEPYKFFGDTSPEDILSGEDREGLA